MGSELKIGDSFYHPCSMDIIEHKVTSIRQYEQRTEYVLKSVRQVGACGRIEVIISESNGKFRFVELIDEELIEYSRGLGDFVEGFYYPTLEEARLEFYKIQINSALSNVSQKERLLKEAKDHLAKIEAIIEQAKRD
jgi:DNA-binding transcriptional regulator YhcF (GntR family)